MSALDVVANLKASVSVEIDNMLRVAREAYDRDLHAGCAVKKAFPSITWATATQLCWIASGDGEDAQHFWHAAIKAAEEMDASYPGGSA